MGQVTTILTFAENYISEKEMEELKQSANTVWKKINGMISYLKRSQRTNSTNKTNQTNQTNQTSWSNICTRNYSPYS